MQINKYIQDIFRLRFGCTTKSKKIIMKKNTRLVFSVKFHIRIYSLFSNCSKQRKKWLTKKNGNQKKNRRLRTTTRTRKLFYRRQNCRELALDYLRLHRIVWIIGYRFVRTRISTVPVSACARVHKRRLWHHRNPWVPMQFQHGYTLRPALFCLSAASSRMPAQLVQSEQDAKNRAEWTATAMACGLPGRRGVLAWPDPGLECARPGS